MFSDIYGYLQFGYLAFFFLVFSAFSVRLSRYFLVISDIHSILDSVMLFWFFQVFSLVSIRLIRLVQFDLGFSRFGFVSFRYITISIFALD